MNTTEMIELTRLLTERAEELRVKPDLDAVVQAPAPAATGGRNSGGRRRYLVTAAASVVVIGIGGVLTGMPTVGQSSGDSNPLLQIDAAFAEPLAGEVIVWLDPGASAAAVEAVELRLAQSADVERVIYVDRAATYDEFRAFFADQPEILELVTPEDLPTSFRVQASMPSAVAELLADLEVVDQVDGFTE